MIHPYYQKGIIEAGCDEAGRGCLAGPVYAAAVILPDDFHEPRLRDSKKLSPKLREELREIIIRHAVAWAVASVDNREIDQINILNASIMAMHKALEKLQIKPEFILVDGNRFKTWQKTPYQCIVKGDDLYASIAAASVLAKTFRDDCMRELHKQFPEYGWYQNKGYPTSAHRQAIQQFGITPLHRKTFIHPAQLQLTF